MVSPKVRFKRIDKALHLEILYFHSQFTECLKSTTTFSYNWSIFFKKVVVLFKHSVNWEWKHNISSFRNYSQFVIQWCCYFFLKRKRKCFYKEYFYNNVWLKRVNKRRLAMDNDFKRTTRLYGFQSPDM
jgi:hypothetical protein